MKILHVAASLDLERGGPVEAIVGLTQALARKGVEVSVFATSKNAKSIYVSSPKAVTIKSFPTSSLSRLWPFYSRPLAKALKKEVRNFDLIHIHEIWHYPHFACYKAAKAEQKPFLVSVRGALDPWCLNHKAFKKKVYSALIQRKILKDAAGLHAVAKEEVKNICNFVDNRNIRYVPNGLNVEDFEKLPDKRILENLFSETKDKKVILFLGRIHPVKGLDLLAQAFGKVVRRRGHVCLLIVGPDNDGYQTQIERILEREGILDAVIFPGMLTGDDKLAALSRADIFVLPSYSEVFGMSILEAMACKLPVVITKQCYFPEVEKMRVGKIIDAHVEHLSRALIELLDNPDLCEEMGRRGKRLVVQRYSWDKVADKMIGFYEEILNGQKVVDMEGK